MTTPPQGEDAAERGSAQATKFGPGEYDPAEFGGPVREPRNYRTLKMLTLLALAFYLLNTIVSTLASQSQAFAEATRQMLQDMGMPSAEVEATVQQQATGPTPQQLIMGVLGIALFLAVYLGLTKRKNWARVTGIVFAILGVVATLGGTLLIIAPLLGSGGLGIFSVTVTGLYAAVSIYWLVLAFTRGVREYIQQP